MPPRAEVPLRVVFLDIDGVICTRRSAGWGPDGRPLGFSTRRRPVRAIGQAPMQHLNALCAETGALVVVSSTWRLSRDVPEIFSRHAFTGQFHPDWRTDADGPVRSEEIARWLQRHVVSSFVVIDDKSVELQPFADRLILTNNYQGLVRADVDRSVSLLSEDLTMRK